MEFALAEKTIYVPPIVLGMILLYRQFMVGFWHNHPIAVPIITLTSGFQYIADTMMKSLTYFMSSSQEKSLAVQNMSVAILNTVMNNVQMVIRYSHTILSKFRFQANNMTAGVYSIFTKTSDVFHSMQFHFKTVVFQTYNFTAGLYSSMLSKSKETSNLFTDYFSPKQKSLYEEMYIVSLIVFVSILIGLTVYYFSILRRKTFDIPKTPVKQVESKKEIVEPVALRKNPVRRRKNQT
jgi:hypothetical protein